MEERILTDEEIQMKMDEYNALLESNPELKYILDCKYAGKAFSIPSDLLATYKELIKLDFEIRTGKEYFEAKHTR